MDIDSRIKKHMEELEKTEIKVKKNRDEYKKLKKSVDFHIDAIRNLNVKRDSNASQRQ